MPDAPQNTPKKDAPMLQLKSGIRRDMLETRSKLSRAQAKQASIMLAERLVPKLLELTGAHSGAIGAYAAIKRELDLFPSLSELAKHSPTFALPCVAADTRQLVFRGWQPGQPLIKAQHGIRTPDPSSPAVIPSIICVPLIAADGAFNRLGYGGGYYDATIKQCRAQNPALITIGIAYDFQLLDSLPNEAHDQPLDYLCTPTKWHAK